MGVQAWTIQDVRYAIQLAILMCNYAKRAKDRALLEASLGIGHLLQRIVKRDSHWGKDKNLRRNGEYHLWLKRDDGESLFYRFNSRCSTRLALSIQSPERVLRQLE